MNPPETNRSKRSIDTVLFSKFLDDYRFILAKTKKEKNRALKLRHEVFLQELKYEMNEDKTKNLETDEYDEFSLHCLIEHKRSGLLAGCVRLIIPSNDTNSKFNKLPVEIRGQKSLNHETLNPNNMPRLQICEVSRLVIARKFRSRSKVKNQTDIILDGQELTIEEEKTSPMIALGLFLCTYSLVILSGRQHAFAMMEPRLPRLLSLSGFNFTQVSEAIEHHGSRYAYYIDHTKAQKGMSEDLLPFYLHIKNTLKPQLEELLSTSINSIA